MATPAHSTSDTTHKSERGDTVVIVLSRTDANSVLDALRQRAEAWQHHVQFLRGEIHTSPFKGMVVDTLERLPQAEQIVEYYRTLVAHVERATTT